MKYCSVCLYPDTKPDLWFDPVTGLCSACMAFSNRSLKNWKEWETKFHQLMEANKGHFDYDCIIPVSGGKDSTYQVIKLLEMGYNPLCVNARTDDLSGIGRVNLDNIACLGVDVIEINTNRKVRNRIAKHALETVGDISWGEHVCIFTIPFSVSCQYGIPLIIYGENPQNEYGAGPLGTEKVTELGYDWLQEFGGLNGLRLGDLVDQKIATERELSQYKMPDELDLELTNSKAIFLGQFFPWDGKQNADISSKHGFKVNHGLVEGTNANYENLDNYQTGIHDYFKFIKFGFGRTTDLVCSQIRRGTTTREKGKQDILRYDGSYPFSYLYKPLNQILEPLRLTENQFLKIVNTFANKELFDIESDKTPKAKFLNDLEDA